VIFGIPLPTLIAAVVALVGAVTGLGSLYVTFRKDKGTNRAAEAAAVVAAQQLKSQIDVAIDSRMKAELQTAYDLIDGLREEVEALKAEPVKLKSVIRRFIFTLHDWARANGHTDIPWPADEDLELLAPELVNFSPTTPAAEARAAAKAARDPDAGLPTS
jgi:hypothetical protein